MDERPDTDEAANIRRAAWKQIVKGLRGIANRHEVLAAPGAWQFVANLELICQDIGDHLTKDSLEEAMNKLKKGFYRAPVETQFAIARDVKQQVRAAWADEPEPRSMSKFKKVMATKFNRSPRTIEDYIKKA